MRELLSSHQSECFFPEISDEVFLSQRLVVRRRFSNRVFDQVRWKSLLFHRPTLYRNEQALGSLTASVVSFRFTDYTVFRSPIFALLTEMRCVSYEMLSAPTLQCICAEFQHLVFRVASSGNSAALEQMFQNDPQLVNRPDFDGNMPLHWAALSGSTTAVQVCLDALDRRDDLDVETEVQRQNFMNQDAVCCAVTSGNLDSVKLLFSYGGRTDYRFSNTVPVLIEALHGSNVQLTSFLLDTLDVDFDRSRNDRYWVELLKPDLIVSLAHYKLLQAHAVPYDVKVFCEICDALLEFTVENPGLEEFLIYLCEDAFTQFTAHITVLANYFRRVSCFFLEKLVPHNGNLDCVHRLQRFNVFQSPVSAAGWLHVLTEWGLSPKRLSSVLGQDSVLLDLIGLNQQDNSSYSKPIISDPSLLPLVLYLAVLALKFPFPTWLSSWNGFFSKVCNSDFSLSTSLDLHATQHSGSVFDFFWRDVFPFICGRAMFVLSCNDLSLEMIETQLDLLFEHTFLSVSSTHPKQADSQAILLIKVLSLFPASSKLPGHELFLHIIRQHICPWIPPVTSPLNPTGETAIASMHTLSNIPLLECVLEFSPHLVRFLISRMDHWSDQTRTDVVVDYLILSYRESELTAHVPEDYLKLLSPNSLGTSRRSLFSLLESRVAILNSEPYTLRAISKIHVRLHLRRFQFSSRYQPSLRSINQLIQSLPIPSSVQEFLKCNT
ncbi:ankyrin repeat protein [Opisthorchis viverrini]|uniref:Ankyrin repeat protein n=1 Tax=Opisthorchis viverrini TaxID=6198 RepID=A0A1S8WX48_OPIVI|nr:ankyrin repeat protein [Opisthorchis viverrini]